MRANRSNETRAVIEATGMDVFMAGERCAVHCYSREGTTVVLIPLREFIGKARREVDGNRRSWPTGAPSPVTPPPSGRGRRGPLPEARLAAYQAARQDYEVRGISRRQAALARGLHPHAFYTWLRNARAKEKAAAA